MSGWKRLPEVREYPHVGLWTDVWMRFATDRIERGYYDPAVNRFRADYRKDYCLVSPWKWQPAVDGSYPWGAFPE